MNYFGITVRIYISLLKINPAIISTISRSSESDTPFTHKYQTNKTSMITPKVLFLTYEFEDVISGGIGRVITGLAHTMFEMIEFDIFLFRWSNTIENFSGDLFKNGKIKESFDDDYRERVLKIVTENNYNIIHVLHVGEHTYEILKLLKESDNNIRIVYSTHSISKFEKDIRKNSELNLLHEQFIVTNSDHIHLLSETGKKWLLQSYPEIASSKTFHIIPNAIEFPKETRLANINARTILCMSRWSHGKGIEYLIAAAPKVLEVFPDVKFIIAGRKINSWEHEVHEYISLLDGEIEKLSPSVSSIGWIDDEEKDKLISEVSICVMPSELEYFPYAILEPIAGGVPVISSRIPSVQDMVVEDKDCLMFEKSNSAELAEKIITLLQNPDSAISIAKNAHETISKKYTWERVSNEYVGMYKKILA